MSENADQKNVPIDPNREFAIELGNETFPMKYGGLKYCGLLKNYVLDVADQYDETEKETRISLPDGINADMFRAIRTWCDYRFKLGKFFNRLLIHQQSLTNIRKLLLHPKIFVSKKVR